MLHLHDHGDEHHHDHEHGHGHGHGHHGHDHGPHTQPFDIKAPRWRVAVRFALAFGLLGGAILAAASVMVPPGEAVVVTQFGNPVRVLTEPGLAWKLPVPVQGTIPVDLRLRTTSTGLQDVGTRDGLRVLVQAYVAWQVPADPERVRQFLRAVRNEPDEAARQLRSFAGSALQVTAGGFDLADLVNTDPARVKLAAFEEKLAAEIARQMLDTYGIAVRQVGIERLSLPEGTLAATVARMRTERETVAAQRTAEGLRAAAEIRSNAARDGRIAVAQARSEAAEIEAAARREAAEIHAKAYEGDPQLYVMLRSLDSLAGIVGGNTRIVLRTDAAPFNMLVQGPAMAGLPAPSGVASAAGGAVK
jgi:membrane protease subunit HflC